MVCYSVCLCQLLSASCAKFVPGLFLFVSHNALLRWMSSSHVTQHYKPYWLYFVAFVIVIFGLIVYFWKATRASLACHSMLHIVSQSYSPAEEQGITDIKYPKYINVRGGGGNFESGGSTEKDVA